MTDYSQDLINKQINALIQSGQDFALFRAPQSDIRFIYGNVSELTSKSQINDACGFIFAPFTPFSGQDKVLILTPEIELSGIDAISKWALNYTTKKEKKETDVSIAETTTKAAYSESFKKCHKALENKEFDKLVLARRKVLSLPKNFSSWNSFLSAMEKYKDACVTLFFSHVTGLWLIASPEKLLEVKFEDNTPILSTVALAGTMPLNEQEKLPELSSWSKKNQEEQAYVAQYLGKKLSVLGQITDVFGPRSVRAGLLTHIKTDFTVKLNQNFSLGDIITSLHPTPAVCGLPKEEAAKFISEIESSPRGYFAGFFGPINSRATQGQVANLFVNLRCLQSNLNKVCLYAGSGILTASDEESEWLETESKMQTIFKVL